jgi:hypothetical protein
MTLTPCKPGPSKVCAGLKLGIEWLAGIPKVPNLKQLGVKHMTTEPAWATTCHRRVTHGAYADSADAFARVLVQLIIASGFHSMPGQPGDQPALLQGLLPGFRVFFGAALDEFDASGQRRAVSQSAACATGYLVRRFQPVSAGTGKRRDP